ncbi:P1 family peptidase [Geminicoccaceae bacterium 1502E]|nr:P1 family peptidase [Geminicoccaceae bacterium 1502E]
MITPGPRNALSDVEGLLVGNAEDQAARSGVTVILPERPVAAAVDVRGGAPGTVNTDALAPGGLIRHLDGLVLSGGSTFGLEAASGLMSWLAARGRGFADWGPAVPRVAGAILFDLVNGGDKDWGEMPPYRALAAHAAGAAAADFALGNAGAGLGAVAGPVKGGLGTASAVDATTGITVAALVVSNPVGSPVMPGQPSLWAWHLEQAGELGGQPLPSAPTGHRFETKRNLGQNTTIGVVATDADLDRDALLRLAVMGQDGYAVAVRPMHTPFDGDTLFALSTGTRPLPDRPDALLRLGTIAADVVARALARGVFLARDAGDTKAYCSLWGSALLGGEK